MSEIDFGNDPAKIDRYMAFWNGEDVKRPLVGFSFIGWFPLNEFTACKDWGSAEYVTPEMIDPAAFIDDHVRMLREGEIVADDMIRGACATQVAVPWLPPILGSKLRLLPENVMGDEQKLSWDEALQVSLDFDNPWFIKYMDFTTALIARSRGRFPVSHGPEIGPTDLHAVLRGHTESILDLMEDPEKSAELLWKLGTIFRDIAKEFWHRVPLFHGGFFDAQYSLWSPGSIIRMQEDATAVYSPDLYRKLVQPVDRMIAAAFENSFMHLHSTSMFLLDAFLEIEDIDCFEVNNDASGPPVQEMVPYFQMIQDAERPLLIRGAFTVEEMRLLMDSLEARRLFLNIMVKDMDEVESLRPIVGM
jgi:hypothetical protein